MILGFWSFAARPIPEPLGSRLVALLETAGRTRVDAEWGSLAAWLPARLETKKKGEAIGWAVSGAEGHVPPGLPSVHLEGDTLTIAAPAVPQFPLYWVRSRDDSYVIVCSCLEPLSRLLPRASLSAQRIVCNIAGAVDADRGATVYAGIRRLLPSECVVASSHGVRVERSLPRIGPRYRGGRVEDLAVELRDQLDAAVGRAIGPSGRVAVLASGGLDSSGVLALAAARCGQTGRLLRAISLQSKGPGDDRPYFALLTEALGVVPVLLRPADAGKWVQKALCSDGQPACGGAAACLDMLFYETAASLGADIALCGSAGDYLCGGPLPFAQLARRGHIVAALMGALRVRLPWSLSPWGRVRSMVLRPFLPKALLRARSARAERRRWMTRRFRDLLESCRHAADRNARRMPDTPDEWMAEWCEGNECVLPNIADVGGQALAVTKAAVFDVFLDFDLVRFVLEIDPVLLCHGHEYRGLYRLAMKGILPESIRTRQDKAGYDPAIAAAILASDGLETLDDLSSLEALAAAGLVDPSHFRPIFNRWLGAVRRGEREESDPGDECGPQVWQLLSAEAFLRQHGAGRDLR